MTMFFIILASVDMDIFWYLIVIRNALSLKELALYQKLFACMEKKDRHDKEGEKALFDKNTNAVLMT